MAEFLPSASLFIVLLLAACTTLTPTAVAPTSTRSQTADPAVAPTEPIISGPTQSSETAAAATAVQVPTTSAAPESTGIPTPETRSSPPPTTQGMSLWRGITVTPENRCSHYDADDYRYSPSVEPRIVDAQGSIYGPYTGTWFGDTKQTDIEHIVARSEAHDSGLCAASADTKKRFAGDLLNLTLASPSVNRHQKDANDAAEWLTKLNSCWYVDRIIRVRLKYSLTIDQREAAAIDRVLADCATTEMIITRRTNTSGARPAQGQGRDAGAGSDALTLYDDNGNGNGRITCAEARAHGIAPV